ncbi:MAG: pitrilysin family protein, partial [Bdellovibrionota bacterium]
HETVRRKLKPLAKPSWPGRPWRRWSHVELGFEPAPKLKDGRWWIERPTEQVHLVWGVEGPTYMSRDRFAAFLLNVYLGGGMSSALFQEIREKNGLAYSVYSTLSPFLDSGLFNVYVATNMANVPVCFKLIEECVDKLKRDLLTEEELQTIKDNLKGTILLSSDSVEARMSSIAKNDIFFNRYIGVDEICREVDAVSPQDVRRVARKLLRDERRSWLALGPKPSKQVRHRVRPKRLGR